MEPVIHKALFCQRTGLSRVRRALVVLSVGAAIVSPSSAAWGQAAQSQVPASQWVPERLPDGQPNVQGGIWRVEDERGSGGRIGGPSYITDTDGRPVNRPSRVIDPPDGRVPYQPWAEALWKDEELHANNPLRPEHIDPQTRCLETVPRIYYYVSNQTILQPPGMVVFLWEIYHQYRVIPLDGSPHIGPTMKLWMGDARGHWEGNTLVVDTTNLSGKSRLTESHFFSSDAHLRERMTFVDANTMKYQVTIEDPTVYTRPWTMEVIQKRLTPEELLQERGQSDVEVWEEGCVEGLDQRPSESPAFKGASTTNTAP
jgi:hypothetical protein